MDSIYIWPDQPVLSIAFLYVVSVIFLWAAREPMLKLMQGLGGGLDESMHALSRWCRTSADEMHKRSRAALLAAGSLDAQGKLDREFHRIDVAFTERIGHYSPLHRRLDDLVHQLEADYQKCGEAPPEVPGWSGAVEAISGLPASGDPNVQKILESIRKSSQEAEKKALQAYREDTSKRHKRLGAMTPSWKEIRSLMERMKDSVSKALEATTRINGYVDDYEKIRSDEEAAARALTFSAAKLFTISLIVLGIALGGAFINFQLIALPMSELVPAGARIGGVPVSTVSALVIVLMEAAVGIFLMDMLGITDLFPKLAGIPSSRRKMILGLSVGALFFLASVESSLAILREQIVAADEVLKLSLAGSDGRVVSQASNSIIPVVGQAVLGFVLPWILAMVAIPLEMLLDSIRHVSVSVIAIVLRLFGSLSSLVGHTLGHVTRMFVQLYDVYISIPLRLEKMLRGESRGGRRREVAA